MLCEDIEGVHHATDFAERIIAALQVPFRFGDDDTHVSASIGIALSADGTETADAILANADIAMYRAKDNGRSRYELFDETMQQWITTQVALEADAAPSPRPRRAAALLPALHRGRAPASSEASRRWCAGNVRASVSSRPTISSRSPKRPD